MGSYVFQLLAAFLSLPLGDHAWEGGARYLPGLPLLFVLPHLLALAARRAARRRARLGAWLERALALSPVLIQLVFVACGWIGALEGRLGIHDLSNGWPGLGLLAALAPFLLAQCLAIDARARLLGPERAPVSAARHLHLRLLASALAPFLIYLAAASLVGLRESWRVHVQEIALWNALFMLFLVGGFVLFLPQVLRWTWNTTPLGAGPVREALEGLAARARFRCGELLLWRTGHQVANAAIVGFLPSNRLVLFSDALLEQLSPRELAGVFAHEIGHARRRHVLLLAGHVLSFVLGAEVLFSLLDAPRFEVELALFGAVLLLWFLSFGWLSRRIELEADLESLELLGEGTPLVRALVEVTGAHAHRHSSWRYFSTAERVRFLGRAEANPAIGRALRRRLQLSGALVALVFLGLAGYEVRELWRSFDEQRVVAELRLGHYDAAAADLTRATRMDPRVARLAEVAAALAPEQRTPEGLEGAALESAGRGDLARAARLVELAVLRGREELDPVLELLEDETEASDLERLPERWRRFARSALPPAPSR